MITATTQPLPVTSPSIVAMLRGYDQATDAISKASATLNILSSAYDNVTGFSPPDKDIYLTVIAILDMVDNAKAALELAYTNKPA